MHKVAVLWNANWPVIDVPPVSLSWLQSTFKDYTVEILGKPADGSRLKPGKYAALVLVNGSGFPLEFWDAISDFLKAGGHLFYLGGNPFSRPFRQVSGKYLIEPPTPAYARALGIVQSFPLDITTRHDVDPSWKMAGLSRCWRLFQRLNEVVLADAPPGELGWQGAIEARLDPLVRVMEEGHHVATAAVLVTHEGGLFNKSRWLLAPCQLERLPDAKTIREFFHRTISATPRWLAEPTLAVYRPEEQPSISIRSSFPAGKTKILVKIGTESGVVTEKECVSGESISLPKGLPQGFYKIECFDHQNGTVVSTQGFWIARPGDLHSGRRLGVNADWFTREGKSFAVAGTTYMCGEEHRDFLLRPNPAVWRRDMEAMKRAGTNMLRTGFWQKWAEHSHRDGRPRQNVLRAFEAFLLCAGHCDLPVIFNFFAFVPHTWKARHAYLDPKALAAQKRFLGGFGSAAKVCDFVAWDLINEPSVTSHKQIWLTRSVGGPAEKVAWRKWIEQEYGGLDQARLAWRMPPEWDGSPPTERDFAESNIFEKRYPLLASAFQRYAQKIFCDWTQVLSRELKRSGAPFQLVTVGQDEGGSNTRPSPLFHGHLVDFTSNHSWHHNDDILWDALVARKRGVPLLIEETGMMPHESLDRTSTRSLKAFAVMLERKLALSFGGGAAGFIQWLWQTNSYLPTDGEAAIGLHLADGAEKPEMRIYAAMAEFAGGIGPWLGKMEEPDICVVFPQGDGFSIRPRSIETHRRAVRSLEYGLGLPTRVIGEYQSEDLGNPKLIVVPAHDTLSEGCWKNLLQAVKRGAWLTVTGDFRRDADYRVLGHFDFLAHALTEDLVSNIEMLQIGKRRFDVAFPAAEVKPFRKLSAKGPNRVLTQKFGKGTILFSPLPLEGSISAVPLLEFYRMAAEGASVALKPQLPGRLCRRIAMPKADLFVLVNETSSTISIRSLLPEPLQGAVPKGSLPAGRCALYLIEKENGRCLAAYQPPPLE